MNAFARISGLGRARRAAVLDNGIFDMRAHRSFSDVAALHENGTCYIAPGYRHNQDFLNILSGFQKTGLLPGGAPKFQTVPELQDIKPFYEGSTRSAAARRGDTAQTAGRRRMLRLIEHAAEMQASDIRIIKHDTYTAVRLRVAGRELSYGHNWTAEEGDHAISGAFSAQNDGSGEVTRAFGEFQSFSISSSETFPLPRNVGKLRVQTGYHESDVSLGQSLTARVFYTETEQTAALHELGLDREVLGALERARVNLKGAVIVGGETGDGKSTTLVRALEEVYDAHDGRRSIVTLEDPVEYRIRRDGIMQIPLKSAGDEAKRASNYRKALLNFMRINPDVGMISEIRDGAGGRELLQFVQSGHAIYSTIHVGKAYQIPFRMISLGVPPEEVCQTGIVRVYMKQTLVRLLCNHCKIPMRAKELSEAQARALEPLDGDEDRVYLRNAEGCAHCRKDMNEAGARAWAGLQRLIAVAEIIEPDDTFNAYVRANDANGALAYWLKPLSEGGMDGIEIEAKMSELVLSGQLDPFDCLGSKGDLSKRLSAGARRKLGLEPAR